jgi:integrase
VRSPWRVINGGIDRGVERPMLTVAEVQALTDAMPENLKAAVSPAAWGALRRGEVLGLRRRNVDPLRSLVRVEQAQVELNDGSVTSGPPKTDAGVRIVHLPDHAMGIVENHLAQHVDKGRDALLFTGVEGCRCAHEHLPQPSAWLGCCAGCLRLASTTSAISR